MATIYEHPRDYELEHSGPETDVPFFVQLARTHRPPRVLEFGCGNGRIAIPLADAAKTWGGSVAGVDTSVPMLEAARKDDKAGLVSWCEGDVTSWQNGTSYDFIFSACSSLSHLTAQKQQIAVWRNAYELLAEGGRFVVAEVMPDYPTLAEAMKSPSRAAVCLDGDFHDGDERLLRCRAAQYKADSQLMRIRYFYDRFSAGALDRFVDGYEAHVFFPNELRLLFKATGFEIEAEWGDYEAGALRHTSRAIILCGRKTAKSESSIDAPPKV